MSTKYQQHDKQQSRKWFAPFGLGIIVGVVLTLVVGQFRNEMQEEATVANAALEGARPLERGNTELAAPERQPEAPAAPPPTAAEPAASPEPAAEPPAPAAPANAAAPVPSTASTGSAPNAPLGTARDPQPAPAPAPAAPSKAPATPVYAAAERREPIPAAPAAPAPVTAARPQLPAASSTVHAPPPSAAPQPTAPAPAPAKPAAPVDPNSEDAKLAAAAQVRVKGDTPIDSMLDQALTADKKAPAPAPAPAPTLAQTPSRDDVVNTMSVLVPAIRGCAQGQSGLASMSIVVLSDGRVESAALSSGPFQGTASGRCMEGVVRRARFPHFKQANFRVQFPFAVQ